ncbi:OmpA family protein [Paracoccus sp. JM45]|nr:OmpA family protein [Paracoccus sp. JM45]
MAKDNDTVGTGALTVASGALQTERADAMPGLARVLSEEVWAGLDPASLTCLTGGTFPCADGDRAQTPRGIVIEQNGASQLRLAASENQMLRVNKNGDLVQRAAEENTKETEAAREAARQSEPVNAAALNAGEGTGNVTRQAVTKDTTRSSSEDFATNLRDALSGKTDEAKDDDDDNNNLTKALLLGAGALAVGSYLNNNRQVALSAPDRVVVTREDGSQEVIKDEVALLRQPGSNVSTENFDDGSSRTIVTREDGSRVVTIRDADLRVLRRTLVSADGSTTQLIDDTTDVQPVDLASLPEPAAVQTNTAPLDEDELRAALRRETATDRRFTLSQIRNIPEVRSLVAPVNIDAITFDSGSAAIRPDQAQQLQSLGRVIEESVASNPAEIFMIEGYTDTVGADAFNLALSDRRAESVALALTEYFDVPPENLVTQGYGEQYLRIRAEGDIRDNRRASVRRITDLLQTAQAQ